MRDHRYQENVMKDVKAKFSEGVFKPPDPHDPSIRRLEDGAEVFISIKETPSLERKLKALEAAAGGWKATHDPEDLKRNTYADNLVDTRGEPRLKGHQCVFGVLALESEPVDPRL
jgi:hypothetical protein